jgi:hypothetical protein
MSASAPVDLNRLHAKIGQLALKNGFLEGALIQAGMLSAKRCWTARTSWPLNAKPSLST